MKDGDHTRRTHNVRRTAATLLATGIVATLGLTLTTTPAHATAPVTPVTITTTAYPSRHGTLSGIAANLCDDWRRWPTIINDPTNQRNHPGWTRPEQMGIGWRLNVPCATGPTTTPAATIPPSPPPSPTPGTSTWAAPLPVALRCVSRFLAPRPGHLHQGIDLTAASGTRIRAIRAGTVKTVTWDGGAGWYVMLNHGGGTYSVYMHMVRRSFLRAGQRVTAGQTIGYVGSTGHSSGPHLHIEIHIHGAWSYPRANPATFLRTRGINVRGC